jgi:hypothetical protein
MMGYLVAMKTPALKSPVLADVQLVLVSRPCSSEAVYCVKVGALEAGTVSRFRNTRTEINPWRAFRGVPGRFTASFYAAEGGLDAAVGCVLERALTR